MDGTEHRHLRSPGCTLAELPLQHGQQMLYRGSWHRQPMGRLNRPGTRRRRAAERPAMARCGRARAPWVDRLTVAADAVCIDRSTDSAAGWSRNSSPNHCVLLLYATIDLISVSCGASCSVHCNRLETEESGRADPWTTRGAHTLSPSRQHGQVQLPGRCHSLVSGDRCLWPSGC